MSTLMHETGAGKIRAGQLGGTRSGQVRRTRAEQRAVEAAVRLLESPPQPLTPEQVGRLAAAVRGALIAS